jgi:hypothetical protein
MGVCQVFNPRGQQEVIENNYGHVAAIKGISLILKGAYKKLTAGSGAKAVVWRNGQFFW